MSVFRTVLIPLDGTENAERIVGRVAGLARGLDLHILLLTVLQPSRSGTASGEQAGEVSAIDRAHRYLEEISQRLNGLGIVARSHVVSGHPAEAIVEQADRLEADLIAMATHRGGRLSGGLLGSVTSDVVRRSHLPVLAMHPAKADQPPGQSEVPDVVVVPLDGSEMGELPVALAQEIARVFRARLAFVRVVQFPTREDQVTDYVGIARHVKEAYEYAQQFAERARTQGLNASADAPVGLPPVEIVRFARQHRTPIVVMATRGLSGLKRLVLGNVT
ncbi:MAG: universal stress protein, partial [Chloroflexi bacterium]|nr:universal stress protein [Chloroflexota bacterium]